MVVVVARVFKEYLTALWSSSVKASEAGGGRGGAAARQDSRGLPVDAEAATAEDLSV